MEGRVQNPQHWGDEDKSVIERRDQREEKTAGLKSRKERVAKRETLTVQGK